MIRYQKWPLLIGAGGIGDGVGILPNPYVGGGGFKPPVPGGGTATDPSVQTGNTPPPNPGDPGLLDLDGKGPFNGDGVKTVVLKHLALDLSAMMQILDLFTELNRSRSSSPAETFLTLATQAQKIIEKRDLDLSAANKQLFAAIGAFFASAAGAIVSVIGSGINLSKLREAQALLKSGKAKEGLERAEKTLEKAKSKLTEIKAALKEAKDNPPKNLSGKERTDLVAKLKKDESDAQAKVEEAEDLVETMQEKVDLVEMLGTSEELLQKADKANQLGRLYGEVCRGISEIFGALLRLAVESVLTREQRMDEAKAQSVESNRNLEATRQNDMNQVYSQIRDLIMKLVDFLNQMIQSTSSTAQNMAKAVA